MQKNNLKMLKYYRFLYYAIWGMNSIDQVFDELSKNNYYTRLVFIIYNLCIKLNSFRSVFK